MLNRSKQNFQYQFRIRNKEDDQDETHHCFNCFVSFKQSRDYRTLRGFSQKSMILVCKHPFTSLAYKILSTLVNVVNTLPEHDCHVSIDSNKTSSMLQQSLESAPSDELLSTIEVAMRQLQEWPAPAQDHDIELPFFGDLLKFSVPILSSYVDMGVETDLSLIFPATTTTEGDLSGNLDDMRFNCSSIYSNNKSGTYGLGGGAGMFADDNLIELFKPLGLLPHLWTLWELVVTGKNIVVWSPSADQCSRVVTALVSMCAPLVYGGDFRPYINPYDSDVVAISKSLAQHAQEVYSTATPSCLDQNKQDNLNNSKPMGANTEAEIEQNFAVPREFRLQSSSRQSQGLAPGGGAVGQCIGGDNDLDKHSLLKPPRGDESVRPTSIIVGITNPYLLKSFDQADAALFLPLTDPKPKSPFTDRRKRNHSLFSSRVSSLEKNGAVQQGQNLFPEHELSEHDRQFDMAPVPDCVPLRRNKTTEGRIHQTESIQKPSPFVGMSMTPPPITIDDDEVPPPPPPPLRQPRSTSPAVRIIPGSSSSRGMKGLRLHACNVNRIDKTTSLDLAFERWSAVGGVGTSDSRGNTLLTLRSGVSVKPDQTMLQRLLHRSLDSINSSPAGSMSSSPTATPSLGHSPNNTDEGTTTLGYLGNLLGDLGGVLSSNCVSTTKEDPQEEEQMHAVMCNMLVREHFRQLTYALMKPFENHFQGSLIAKPPTRTSLDFVSEGSPSIDNYQQGRGNMTGNYGIIVASTTNTNEDNGDVDIVASKGMSLLDPFSSDNTVLSSPPLPSPTTNSSIFTALKKSKPHVIAGANRSISPAGQIDSKVSTENVKSMSPSRRGASSLWLYSNPIDLLGRRGVAESVDEYLNNRNYGKNIPDSFIASKRTELFSSFGSSNTFLNYYNWRKSELNTAILLDISQACSSLTVNELVEQLAIEKGSDVLTKSEMQELADRIGMYIIAISSEHNQHCGHYSPAAKQNAKDENEEQTVMTPYAIVQSGKCVCCRHFEQNRYQPKDGDQSSMYCTTDRLIDRMQDQLNCIVRLIRNDEDKGSTSEVKGSNVK